MSSAETVRSDVKYSERANPTIADPVSTGHPTLSLDSLFSRELAKPRLLVKPQALTYDYVPEFLPHREEEAQLVIRTLSLLLTGPMALMLSIYGRPGSGKTAVICHVVNQLAQLAGGHRINVAYSNARELTTANRIISNLAAQVGLVVPPRGLAVGDVLDRLRSHVRSHKGNTVFILDEVHHLLRVDSGEDLLYGLANLNYGFNTGDGLLSVIIISNHLNFSDKLSHSTASRLQGASAITFPPYTVRQLADILKQRAEIALRPGSWSPAAINLVAALAASEHGDARLAIDLLRGAVLEAEASGKQAMSEEEVRVSANNIQRGQLRKTFETLPIHEKLALSSTLILSRRGNPPSTGEAYAEYTELCRQLGIQPLVQRSMARLIERLADLGILEASVKSLGRHGRKAYISITVDREELHRLTRADPLLSSLEQAD